MKQVIQSRLKPIPKTSKVEELIDYLNRSLINTYNLNAQRAEIAVGQPKIIQELEAADRVSHTESDTAPVQGFNAAITLSSTPTISAGYDGERILLIGMHDTYTLTLQDEGNLTGSTLQLAGGADITLGKYDTIELVYLKELGAWCEVGRSNN